MTNEDINGAINYLKSYRMVDERTHNMSSKDSVAYFATDRCLKYWDMAIKALEQGDVLQEIRQEINDEFLRCDANAWSDIAKGLLSARCIIDRKIKELSE